MATCFVMQPFDKGVFDKRYEDVFCPAIRDAGLEPYRVDLDPSVYKAMEAIEAEIRKSAICLAEITLDNPNVWFELGYAIACDKKVVLVCSRQRTAGFPFDINHLTIIYYLTDSPKDYANLQHDITTRIKAYREKPNSPVAKSHVLDDAPWDKPGNIYWLAHDLKWTISALQQNHDLDDVLHGLDQVLHHLCELGGSGSTEEQRLMTLRKKLCKLDPSKWAGQSKTKERYVEELEGIKARLGRIAETKQTRYRSTPQQE